MYHARQDPMEIRILAEAKFHKISVPQWKQAKKEAGVSHQAVLSLGLQTSSLKAPIERGA